MCLGGRTFDLPPGFELPPSILVWGVVFFLLGYAVYASLMAALGALVPNLKEGSQATIFQVGYLVRGPTVLGRLAAEQGVQRRGGLPVEMLC